MRYEGLIETTLSPNERYTEVEVRLTMRTKFGTDTIKLYSGTNPTEARDKVETAVETLRLAGYKVMRYHEDPEVWAIGKDELT